MEEGPPFALTGDGQADAIYGPGTFPRLGIVVEYENRVEEGLLWEGNCHFCTISGHEGAILSVYHPTTIERANLTVGTDGGSDCEIFCLRKEELGTGRTAGRGVARWSGSRGDRTVYFTDVFPFY